MKKTFKITESELSNIILEAVEEISNKKQGSIARFVGYEPGFNADNARHMKGYDTIKDSVMYVLNNYKLRPNVISGILSSIEEDLSLGQY